MKKPLVMEMLREQLTSPGFRDHLFDLLPGLTDSLWDTVTFKKICRRCLFGPYTRDDQWPELVVRFPHQVFHTDYCRDTHAHGNGVSTKLNAFSDRVFPLHIYAYRRPRPEWAYAGRVCAVSPRLPAEVASLLDQELCGAVRGEARRTNFLTGETLSSRELARRIQAAETSLERRVAVALDGPGLALAKFLNEQPTNTFSRIFKKNWPCLVEAALNIPADDDSRLAVLRVMAALRESHRMLYRTGGNTARIHTCGESIHLLPRALRKIALAGGTTLDLRSAQLAIIAMVWNVPVLSEFLDDPERNIWCELCAFLGLDTGSYKELLKHGAVYPLCFGMERSSVEERLAKGTDDLTGIGAVKARKFFDHHIIAALCKGRERMVPQVEVSERVKDAFGNWLQLVTPEGSPQRGKEIRSLLAQQAQSYEMALMLAILPVLEDNRGNVSVLSFLHDGLTIHVRDQRRVKAVVKDLKEAVKRRADELRIHTCLDSE